MYARNLVFTGTDADQVAAYLDKEVAPVASQQKGFRQLAAAGDRASGTVSILSVWDTLEDLEASDSALAKFRQESVARFGGQLASVDVFEQVVMEVGQEPPRPGCVLFIAETRLEQEKIDEAIAMFRTENLPAILATPGVRAVRNLINRQTGQGRISVVYSDKAALEAANAARRQRMDAARERGIGFGDESIFEILYANTV